jgi:SAM-dependent methyltransferase
MTTATTGTAQVQGPLWSVRADDWAAVHEHNMRPVYDAVLDLVHAGPGMSLLDVGCGSGTAVRLAADRGADVAALDAAPAFAAHVRRRVPGADVRVGDLQFLPFDDESFDVVCGFNSFQYAADVDAALREARRVLRPGGRLSMTVWGPAEECELAPHLKAVGALLPPPPAGAPGPFCHSGTGALRALLEDAGLEVAVVADASGPFAYPDEATALRGLTSSGPCVKAINAVGEDMVRGAIAGVIAPNRREDGSYRFENVWRFAIGRKG